MFCPKCGKENPDGCLLCNNCGTLLASFDTQPTPSTQNSRNPECPSAPQTPPGFSQPSSRPSPYKPVAEKTAKPQPQKIKKQSSLFSPKNKSRRKSAKRKKTARKSFFRRSSARPKRDRKVVHKTVNKKRGCLTYFLGLLLLLIMLGVAGGALLVYHYGYETILARFGIQISQIDKPSSSTPPSSSQEPSSNADSSSKQESSETNSRSPSSSPSEVASNSETTTTE